MPVIVTAFTSFAAVLESVVLKATDASASPGDVIQSSMGTSCRNHSICSLRDVISLVAKHARYYDRFFRKPVTIPSPRNTCVLQSIDSI
jgi:hypothetical protein